MRIRFRYSFVSQSQTSQTGLVLHACEGTSFVKLSRSAGMSQQHEQILESSVTDDSPPARPVKVSRVNVLIQINPFFKKQSRIISSSTPFFSCPMRHVGTVRPGMELELLCLERFIRLTIRTPNLLLLMRTARMQVILTTKKPASQGALYSANVFSSKMSGNPFYI